MQENAPQRVQRILLACVGGYYLSAALVAWGGWLLSFTLPRSEAVVLMAMLGFVIYLLVLLWAFAESRLSRLWLVLAGIPLADLTGRVMFTGQPGMGA